MVPVIIINHCIIDYTRQNNHIFINWFAFFDLVHGVYTFMKYLYKSFYGNEVSKIRNNGVIFKAKDFMLNEHWELATPPLANYGMPGSAIIISGNPAYFKQLADNGKNSDGFGIIYDYQGGVKAYFDQIAKPLIDIKIASMGLNPATFVGTLSIDIEVAYPATNEELSSWNHGFTNFAIYMKNYHQIEKENAIKIYNGLCAQYYPHLINYLRQKFPKAKIGWYDFPFQGPHHHTWYANSAKIPAIIDNTENNLAWLLGMLDYISPSCYMYYDLEDNWNAPGRTSYDDYRNARTLYFQYCADLKAKTGLLCLPTVCPVYIEFAGAKAGKPVENEEWSIVNEMLTLCQADGAIIWANARTVEDATNISAGLLAGSKTLNEFRMR